MKDNGPTRASYVTDTKTTVQLGTWVPRELHAAVEGAAKHANLSKAAFVRRVLTEYFRDGSRAKAQKRKA